MAKSTASTRRNKPPRRLRNSAVLAKPYTGFPLTAHPTGRWCKKCKPPGAAKTKTHYFGYWKDSPDGWIEAEKRFKHDWPYIVRGETPPPMDGGDDGPEYVTVADVCESFMESKEHKLKAGELSPQTFADYHKTVRRLVKHFGRDRRADDLRAADFAVLRASLVRQFSVVTLRNEINRVRIIFKFAHDEQLIPKPVHYGQSFEKPSAMTLRKARHEAGPRLFHADELRCVLKDADPIVRAMVLLGINFGFGNTDVASLPQSAVNFKTGWIEFPRPKTAVQRRCPMWPETAESLQKAIELRPNAKRPEDAGLCFITIQGNRWVRTMEQSDQDDANESKVPEFSTVNTLAKRFGAVLRRLNINGRKRLGFYTLRHTFETVAGESKDQVAVDALMGHVDASMAAAYREGISDARLQAVVETVHGWLFPPADVSVEDLFEIAVATKDDPEFVNHHIRERITAATAMLEAALAEMVRGKRDAFVKEWRARFISAKLAIPDVFITDQAPDEPDVIKMPARTA